MPTIDDDLRAIFADAGFNTCAEFTIDADTDTTLCVDGRFTDSSEGVSMLSGNVEAYNPTFLCRTAAITTVRRGMSVEINDTVYTVERIEKAGTGASTVHLKT